MNSERDSRKITLKVSDRHSIPKRDQYSQTEMQNSEKICENIK